MQVTYPRSFRFSWFSLVLLTKYWLKQTVVLRKSYWRYLYWKKRFSRIYISDMFLFLQLIHINIIMLELSTACHLMLININYRDSQTWINVQQHKHATHMYYYSFYSDQHRFFGRKISVNNLGRKFKNSKQSNAWNNRTFRLWSSIMFWWKLCDFTISRSYQILMTFIYRTHWIFHLYATIKHDGYCL